jgi:hypothetical protein
MSHAISTKAPEVVVDAAAVWARVSRALRGNLPASPMIDIQIVADMQEYVCHIRYMHSVYTGRSVTKP